MDRVRDLVVVEHARERGAVDDVALHEWDLRVRHESEPAIVRAVVEADDVRSFRREQGAGPRANAAERAGDEEPLLGRHGSM